MDFTLEDSTTDKVSPVLEEIIKSVLSNSKVESAQKDFMFILIIVLMIENGFSPLNEYCEIIQDAKCINAEQLSKWKMPLGIMEATFIMNGFESMPLKLIVSPLGATALVNLIIKDLNSETYSVCVPISRYVVSPQASTIPMIFRDLKQLTCTFKNKILSAVKSRILGHCGYASASLMGVPEELLYKIILYLPIGDIVSVSQTCRRLMCLIDNERLWHELCKRDFVSSTECTDWKALYREKYKLKKDEQLRQISRAAGTMHDYMDYSDFVSYIDNPLWDDIII